MLSRARSSPRLSSASLHKGEGVNTWEKCSKKEERVKPSGTYVLTVLLVDSLSSLLVIVPTRSKTSTHACHLFGVDLELSRPRAKSLKAKPTPDTFDTFEIRLVDAIFRFRPWFVENSALSTHTCVNWTTSVELHCFITKPSTWRGWSVVRLVECTLSSIWIPKVCL